MNIIPKAALPPFVASVIPNIYVRDLADALEWYGKTLHFRVLAFNPFFATVEMAPGRICWIRKNEELAGNKTQLTLHIPNTEAFHKHLLELGVDVDPLEVGVADTWWFEFRDPDGNRFGVWSGLFGLNDVEITMKPEAHEQWNYTMVHMPELHFIGVQTELDINQPGEALANAEALLTQITQPVLGETGQLLYINPIIERYKDASSLTLFVCRTLESREALDAAQAACSSTELTAVSIPSQNYAVFTYPKEFTEFRTRYTYTYRRLGNQFGFLKAELGTPNAYHLEMMHDDRIEVYIPYLCGPNETHNYK